MDYSELFFNKFNQLFVDINKLYMEELGYDLWSSNNTVEYHNYLQDNPLVIEEPFSGSDIAIGDGALDGMGLTGGDPGDTGLSPGMLQFICQQETGHKFGYAMTSKDLNGYDLGDAKGHKTFGYGILYHPISQKFMDTIKGSWTQQELENLFKIHAKVTANKIDSWAQKNGISLNQNQKDAIASGCYNFGMGFLNKSICKLIAQNPNNPQIKTVWAHLSDAQGKKYPGLIKRRQLEANWYFGSF